jgi:dUTP pyrophosphatase
MFIYFASPIDLVQDPAYADSARSSLISNGHTVFAPYRAWGAGAQLNGRLQRHNMAMLAEMDGLVAFIPRNATTIGVMLEVSYAVERGMPVGIITDIDMTRSVSLLWLAEKPNVVIGSQADYVAGKMHHMRPVGRSVAVWDGEGLSPQIGKPGDAGFDLFYTDAQPVTIEPGEFVNVRSKIAVEMPHGTWGMIVGRSSAFKRRLFVAPSVIDNGYRGELFACCWNIGVEPQTIEVGDRIAQLVPFPLTAESMHWAKGRLSDSDRGTSGFGSTGR